MTRLFKGNGNWAVKLLLVAFLINLTTAVALANCWCANDDRNDDPDSFHGWWAPWSFQHRSQLWDINQDAAMDQLLDWRMQWEVNVRDKFLANRNKNYVHEVRTAKYAYEANNWYWTDLPWPQLNEDDGWFEEQGQGYEEKELGWDWPWDQIPGGVERRIYTGYNSLNDATYWFESEAEITRINPRTGSPWFPDSWDYIGRLDGCCAD